MSADIYQDKLKNVWLFGKAVLYSTKPIPQEEVQEGRYCYDLRGSADSPERLRMLMDRTENYFADSILSDVPLKSSRSQGELVPNIWAVLRFGWSKAELLERIRAKAHLEISLNFIDEICLC